MQAAGMSPALREAQYSDATKLREAGSAYENQASKVLEDDINRWNYMENADLASLLDYLGLVSGNLGATTTSRSQGGSTGSPINTGIAILSVSPAAAGLRHSRAPFLKQTLRRRERRAMERVAAILEPRPAARRRERSIGRRS
jgi:hypothetical protein